MTETCPDCGKEGIKNLGSHRRFCPANKDREPPIGTPKDEVKKEQPPKELERPQKPINLVDVQPYIGTDESVAWFMGANRERYYKSVDWTARLVDTDRNESIPCVLILSLDGTILPPFMLPGFIGMYPKDQEFPEPEPEPEQGVKSNITDTTEPFPPFEEEEEPAGTVPENPSIKADNRSQTGDNTPRVIVVPPNNAPPPQKQSIVDRIFHGKKKPVESAPVMSNDIFEKLKNATK